MNDSAGRLSPDTHARLFVDKVIPDSGLNEVRPQEHPKAIILAGQPGAGKSRVTDAVLKELSGDVLPIDPDELRRAYPGVERLRQQHPYTWAGHTHSDASQWAKELRSAAIEGRKNIILDTTLGNGDSAVTLIKELQAKGYEVEIRGVVAHRLESELGVDGRFAGSLDDRGYGRYVPEDVRRQVYDALPGNLDKVHAETGISIRLYGREGVQVYDSHSDIRLPGAAMQAERQARLNSPHITQSLRDDWRAQGRWHAELPEALPNNAHVSPAAATALLDERTALRVVEGIDPNISDARSIDHTVRVRPNMVRGAVIGGAAATVFEAATEGTKIADLYARANRAGAEAALLDFGARSVGGWTGAAVGAKAGTLLGIESGPGAIVTGIIGAGLGAWGASEVVDWIEKYRINNQADSTGKVWTFDPAQPDKGWTHSEREIVGTVGTQVDRPIYGATTQLTADAALTQELNYKASSMAVELRLSAPDQPVNPFSIAGDATDTPSVLPRSWERNPDNGEWRREVVHGVYEHGIKSTTVEVADSTKAAGLDETAHGIMVFNAARSSAAFAKQYDQAYAEHDWSRYGPVPEAVVWAREHPDQVLASDGRTYQRKDDGQWLHDGWIYDSLAEAGVRSELNGTFPQIQAIQKQETPIPSAPERRIEALTPQERDAYEQAMQEANRLGISTPQAQQVAASTVAEVRGEHVDERVTPQAVIAAHAEDGAPRASSVPVHVPEHRMPATAAPMAPKTVVAQAEHPDTPQPLPGKVNQLPSDSSAPVQEASPSPPSPTQPDHPDHALYQQVRDGVAALDAKHGRSFDAVSERMTASLLLLAKDNDLDRVDHVLLSNATVDKPAGHTLFVVHGEPSDPAHQRAAMPTEQAAQTPVEESMQQFNVVSRDARQRAMASQLEQQLEDQRAQQESQVRAASRG